jgi:adenylylsulfate kinase
MIYYSNTDISKPHMTFIGRWSPFHKGHAALINLKLNQNPDLPVLIIVRNTVNDIYSPIERAEIIKLWMKHYHIRGTVLITPDIEGIYWGRDVGYKTEYVNVDEVVKQISASTIRGYIKRKLDNWHMMVPKNIPEYIYIKSVSPIISSGLVVWLTGCPSSGKTTISNRLTKIIKYHFPFLKVQQLDGDIIRNSPLANDVGFSRNNRRQHIIRMAYLAKMIADHGILVICSFISPENQIRKKAGQIIGKRRFIEVYIEASLKSRCNRDKKRLYQKAKLGFIKNLTGFNAPYDIPQNPSVICHTDKENIKESVQSIFNHIFYGQKGESKI